MSHGAVQIRNHLFLHIMSNDRGPGGKRPAPYESMVVADWIIDWYQISITVN